ncbi:MAG: RNase adapter RapZ [Lachnospiraceae bacterium]|nr:RNase adapter RapZ [Lachnospiraceae bacterium]
MRLEIITGMSGAGKRTTLKFLEDLGYFCVDNLPAALLKNFVQLVSRENDPAMSHVAVGIDIRNLSGLQTIENGLAELKEEGIDYSILFLDAEDGVLVRRFKETRRSHPLRSSSQGLIDCIRLERQRISFLKDCADHIIDTSHLLTRDLNKVIEGIYQKDEPFSNLVISVCTFGYKYGAPAFADLMFDVRFLPNPYYIEELRPLTGNDKPIRDFVMKYEQTNVFLDKLKDMLEFLIPHYIDEGKNSLVIAVGCTGGKHRSVVIANELYDHLSKIKGCACKIEHMDILKDGAAKGRP